MLEKTRKDLKDVREELIAWQCQCTSAFEKLGEQKDINSMLRRELSKLKDVQKEAEKAAEETSKLRKRIHELKRCVARKMLLTQNLDSVEDMLEGSESEVEDMVKSYNNSATELAKFLVLLKQLVLLISKSLLHHHNMFTGAMRQSSTRKHNSSQQIAR